MDETSIRDSREEDLAAIAEIYEDAVRKGSASFELIPPGLAEMTRRRAAVVEAGLPYLTAESPDGRVAGFAYVAPYRPRPAYRFTVKSSVYLAEWARGRGLGRRLLEELIGRAEAAGRRQMVAVIGNSSNHASIGLHKALGFREVGVFRNVGWKFGRWLDTVLMQRPLGPGSESRPED